MAAPALRRTGRPYWGRGGRRLVRVKRSHWVVQRQSRQNMSDNMRIWWGFESIHGFHQVLSWFKIIATAPQ